MVVLLRDRILDSIEAYFALSPQMLALDLELPSPDGERTRVSVRSAREKVLRLATPGCDRDAIWSQLLGMARQQREPWDVVAVWMMVPGLRKICWRCHRYRPPLDLAELETEAVGAFFEAVHAADLNRPELGSWLWWTTYRGVQRTITRLRRETPTADIELVGALNTPPHDASRATAEVVHLAVDAVPVADQPTAVDRAQVEGERLGALAVRLGLRPALAADPRDDGEAA